MSECSPALLDALASAYDYFAQKNDASQAKADNGTLKSVYDKRSARRARGWAARKRNGWAPPASAQPESNPFGGEDVSF
jgi:hypothetical protein